jgi:hypothetical protein
MMTKVCPRCETKNLYDFPDFQKNEKGDWRGLCKQCSTEVAAIEVGTNAETRRAERKRYWDMRNL